MATNPKKWSKRVTETSDAMAVGAGTFKQRSATKIAHDVERDAEKSTRRKGTSYRSAMSMLTFYINRAGSNLTPAQRKVLERAKDVLRDEFGPKTKAEAPKKKTQSTTRKPTTRKATRND